MFKINNIFFCYLADPSCSVPGEVPHAIPSNMTQGPFPPGTEITYTCEGGYIGSGRIYYNDVGQWRVMTEPVCYPTGMN